MKALHFKAKLQSSFCIDWDSKNLIKTSFPELDLFSFFKGTSIFNDIFAELTL